jgi:hypothetical protein
MKIVIIDFELPDYDCTYILDGRTMEPLDENQFKEWLSVEGDEVYFVDVQDETWNKFKTEKSKRLKLDLKGLMKLIHESDLLILIKGSLICVYIYNPDEDDPFPYDALLRK